MKNKALWLDDVETAEAVKAARWKRVTANWFSKNDWKFKKIKRDQRRRAPRPISKMAVYRKSGLVRDKLDQFILRKICGGYSCLEIERMLKRFKSLKKITRNAIKGRVEYLEAEAVYFYRYLVYEQRKEYEGSKTKNIKEPPVVKLKKKAS